MQLPKFWARADFTTTARDGRPVTRSALGWSTVSKDDAKAVADERARAAAERHFDAQSGSYGYDVVPPREPLIQTIEVDGQAIALITRNRYGCLVLNTERVLFADIDFPQPAPLMHRGIVELVRSFFTKPAATPTLESQAMEKLVAWQAAHPSARFRAYRTFAGLRLLFVDRLYDPKSAEVRDMLRSLDSDLLYYTLTQRQGSFRARLSPKPWRCGVASLSYRSIVDHPDDSQRVAAWTEGYEPKAAAFDTCRLRRTFGSDAINEGQIAAVVEIHDRLSGAHGTRPLA